MDRSVVDPRVSVFQQAWSDVRRQFGKVRIGVVTVAIALAVAGAIWRPDEGSGIAERAFIGVVSAGIALLGTALLLYVGLLIAAPVRQRNAALTLLGDKERELEELTAPRPKAIVLIRVPQNPRRGHIDGYETVHFDRVLLTDLSGEGRLIRFSLAMADREFLDFGEFQEIYRDRPAIHAVYLSNPLDLKGQRQGSLAFVHGPRSGGMSEQWELTVEDVRTGAVLQVSAVGEHTVFEGSD